MTWNEIGRVVWNILNCPAAITALAGGLLWLLNRIYAKKPAWQAFEGTIIAAVRWAEKEIPDNVEQKSLARLNCALQYVTRIYEQVRGTAPDEKMKAELREGIQIVHNNLDAKGALNKARAPDEPPA